MYIDMHVCMSIYMSLCSCLGVGVKAPFSTERGGFFNSQVRLVPMVDGGELLRCGERLVASSSPWIE
jgi:hypothetical protein